MKKLYLLTLILIFTVILSSCNKVSDNTNTNKITKNNETKQTLIVDEKDDDELEKIDNSNVTISYIEGTDGAYSITDSTITFSNITVDSVYSITGEFNGNIVIDINEELDFELTFNGFTLVSYTECPIVILEGDKVTLSAKKETLNYVYDYRSQVTDEESYSASVYSLVDLDIEGKGSLLVKSTNNNGIHTKDDLSVKNLTLVVECEDNALKGNDEVEIESGTIELIARSGDAIKTTSSDISSKGNQKGTISILSGDITIHSKCDAIDSSYNVYIKEEEGTINLNIYTDSYSSYSNEFVDEVESGDYYYIRTTTKNYKYSVQYLNTDTNYDFVDAVFYKEVTSTNMRGGSTYYYYKVNKLDSYKKLIVYQYDSSMTSKQGTDFRYKTESLSLNNYYDTIALTESYGGLNASWTNFSQSNGGSFGPSGNMGGMGGTSEGNTEKNDYSSKGIKADNEIIIESGNLLINSYDDAIHANIGALENGEDALGNVTINGGNIIISTKDDGIHAENIVNITGGTIDINESYEGVEGLYVKFNGGSTSVISSDDGVNGTTTSGNAVLINDGYLYIYCSGDGIDSNSKTSYQGIIFNGGNAVIISTSGGNSCIDTENGYKYTGGNVIAIGPSSGMTNETTNCSNYRSIATSSKASLSTKSVVSIKVSNSLVAEIKSPTSISALIVYLGSSSASISTSNSSTKTLDANGVYFK